MQNAAVNTHVQVVVGISVFSYSWECFPGGVTGAEWASRS